MINKTELRIGNIISDEGNQRENCYAVVTGLTRWLVHLKQSPEGNALARKYEQVTAIPLSPEILEMCGFENIGEPFRRWISEEIGIDISEGPDKTYSVLFIRRYSKSGHTTYSDRNGPYIEMIFCPQPISFLHQLMNLWHSITGTELSINLEKVKA